MKKDTNEGVDLHRWFAGIILNKPASDVSKQDRLYAKACNFGFPGGLGVKNFMSYASSTYGIEDLTMGRAKELRDRWLESFPEMNQYLAVPKGQGYQSRSAVETVSGRIRSNCSYTQGKNFPFQGLAADGAKLALYLLVRNGYRVVNYIHDEFVVEVPADQADVQSSGIQDLMIQGMRQVCPDVRITVEMGIFDCWKKP
ncbi:DNA polymerase [Bdellovibrionota bacterium FG-1]